jgi:hypothetical protein
MGLRSGSTREVLVPDAFSVYAKPRRPFGAHHGALQPSMQGSARLLWVCENGGLALSRSEASNKKALTPLPAPWTRCVDSTGASNPPMAERESCR